MGVYRVKLAGRADDILLRAKSKTEAIERVVVSVEGLTGEQVEDALDKGERVWKLGDDLPVDSGAASGTYDHEGFKRAETAISWVSAAQSGAFDIGEIVDEVATALGLHKLP